MVQKAESCKSCGQELPLLPKQPGQTLRHWVCGNCGEPHEAALNKDYSLELLRKILPMAIPFDRDALVYPSPEMLEYARSLCQFAVKGTEKRSAPRYPVVAPVPTQPLTDTLEPEGPPFMTASRNLSTSGICLLHDRTLTAKLLVLELSPPDGERIQVLVHLLRCRQRGPYHDLAGEFLTRMAPLTNATSPDA